jgi:hypothetical protein
MLVDQELMAGAIVPYEQDSDRFAIVKAFCWIKYVVKPLLQHNAVDPCLWMAEMMDW